MRLMNMQIYLFLLQVLIVSSTSWKTTTSINGGFQIDTPGETEYKITSIPTAIGTIDYHTYLYHQMQDTVATFLYMISYCSYPEGSFPADSTDLIHDFFDATLEQSATSVSGEVVYTDNISYQGFPGLFWRLHYNGGRSVMKTKAYLIRDRFYSLQVATESDYSLDPNINRFFDSFRIISE